MNSGRLILVRHAETNANARSAQTGLGHGGREPRADAISGDDPHSLSPHGCIQAGLLARALIREHRDISRVLLSPLHRARQTVEPFLMARVQRPPAVGVLDDLREFGAPADGAAMERGVEDNIAPAYHAMAASWCGDGKGSTAGRFPRVESATAFRVRIEALVALLLGFAAESSVLVLAHAGTNGAIILSLLRDPSRGWPRQNNACINVLPIAPGGEIEHQRVLINDVSHLSAI